MHDEMKFAPLTVRTIDRKSRSASFVASTEAIDSYGEIVKQNWRLERYLANPVVLYNHERTGSALPIGTAVVAVVGGKLECTITFVDERANPLAEQVWQSVLQRSLRAVSVGFRPHTVRGETIGDQDVTVLDDNELYEISVTPIGANPEALAKMKALVGGSKPVTREAGAELASLLEDGQDAALLADLGLDTTDRPAIATRGAAPTERDAGKELAAMIGATADAGDLADLMSEGSVER